MEATDIVHVYSDLFGWAQGAMCTCCFSWTVFARVHTEVTPPHPLTSCLSCFGTNANDLNRKCAEPMTYQ